MRRREFVFGCGASIPLFASGCLQTSDDERHPFADRTVTVRVDNESVSDHDVDANARRALEYWAEHGNTYTGFDVDFEVVTGNSPDMRIVYADTPAGCEAVEGFSESVLGCAPILTPQTRVPEPVVARVVAAGRPFGKVAITAKHEVGHVLGLGHEDDPREIMSSRPEDRIPLYDVRIDIWESVLDGQRRSNDATERFTTGLEEWNAEQYDPAEQTFQDANEYYTTALGHFQHARSRTDEFEGHPRVETVRLETVRSLLDRLVSRAELAVSFSETMAEAAVAAAEGDVDTANTLRDEASGMFPEYNDLGGMELRDIAIALGIVRGFDRDDAVDDIEGNE